MALRSRLRKKVAPEFTPALTQNVVQSRPFAPPAKSEITPTLADVQAQLDHTQRFGHHLANFANAQSTPAIIQAKLTIGAPGDKYEQEADRVAGQVVQQLSSPQMESPQEQRSVQRESMPEEDELQMQPLAEQIQRAELPEDDELQMKPMLQRQASRGAIAADAELESAIQQSRGSGQPLADTLRQPMERAFGGVDFSGVKVHTDARSDQLNHSIQAKAFTTGQDIFFRQGAYQPGSQGGQELLAHELTHVVQQTGKKTEIRRKELDKTKFNVVGENHSDSDKSGRRNLEKLYVKHKMETNEEISEGILKNYLEEGAVKIEVGSAANKTQRRIVGDDPELMGLQAATAIAAMAKEVLNLSKDANNNWEKIKKLEQGMLEFSIEMRYAGTQYNYDDNKSKEKMPRRAEWLTTDESWGVEAVPDDQDYDPDTQEGVQPAEIQAVHDAILRENKEQEEIDGLLADYEKRVQNFDVAVNTWKGKAVDSTAASNAIPLTPEEVSDDRGSKFQDREVSMARAMHMDQVARICELNYGQGFVWKIGNQHVKEILKYRGGDPPEYNLVAKDDFEKEFMPWQKEKQRKIYGRVRFEF